MTNLATTTAPATGLGDRRTRTAVWALSVITSAVHVYLGVSTTLLALGDPATADTYGGATALHVFAGLFYLSGVGYLVLPAILHRTTNPRTARLARWALIAWAAGNVVAYVALVQGKFDAFGLADKAVELALIAVLVVIGRRAR